MNICIPVEEDRGLQSPVCNHFGSAPLFLIVDTESGACRPVANANMHQAHGQCQPVAVLSGQDVGSVVVGGIGRGALGKFLAAGIQVFLSEWATVGEILQAFRAGILRPVDPEASCRHPGHGAGPHSCSKG